MSDWTIVYQDACEIEIKNTSRNVTLNYFIERDRKTGKDRLGFSSGLIVNGGRRGDYLPGPQDAEGEQMAADAMNVANDYK